MKIFLFTLLFISRFSLAKSSIELCSEYIEKNGTRFQLGQVWFDSGKNPKDAKQLVNYTVDYKDKPFAHIFSFTGLPKEKLWLDCVYFACGDAACSTESAGSDPESVYYEVKNIPISCKSKVKTDNATRIESFTCKYKVDSKDKAIKD